MVFDFNENWTFKKKDGDSQTVCLPHDAMIHEKRYASCRNDVQTGYFPGGRYEYSKTFTLNDEDLTKKISVLFEGVYRNATVFVNGKKSFFNANGYAEFCVDITPYAVVGENEIKVDVDNSLYPNCRWYSGSGIYRPVSLIITGKNAPKTLKIRTISINPAVIEVDGDEGASIEIYDRNNVIASGKPGRFTIENAKLWTDETPYLYRCVSTLNSESIESKFGIRLLKWSGREGLTVNGKEILLRGGCIHHDGGVVGACCFKDAEIRRVKILKEQGFNCLRMAHNPASREILDACDEIGMYVLDEAFDGWYTPKDYHDFSRDFYDNYKSNLKTMVEKDYNHPCVIMYSVGNEVTETAEKKGIDLCAEMRDIIKSLDNTRPVTCGINVLLDVFLKLGIGVYRDSKNYKREKLPENGNYKDKKTGSSFFNYWMGKLRGLFFVLSKGKLAEKATSDISKSLDIIGLNYASSRYEKDALKYPDRLMVGSETMVGDLPYNWKMVKDHKQLIGDFVWSAWDYLGETCMGWVYQSYKGLPLQSGQGMIDITGLPLAQMEYMKVVWEDRKKPYICVRPLNHSGETPTTGAWQFTNALPSWSWHGFEGKPTVCEAYTTCDSVRLELNGKTVGTSKAKNNIALFDVNYEGGTLRAYALDENGNVVAENELTTGGSDRKLTVNVDKIQLNANGQDLSYVEIEFTDKDGNLLPYIEQRVNIELDGDSAYLQGFGSSLIKTDEVFDKTYHDTYRGRALAVIRASHKTGKTTVTVSSDTVESVKFEINVK